MDFQWNETLETLGAHYLEYHYYSITFVIGCGAHLPEVLQCHCVSFLHKSEQSLPPVGPAQESSPTLLHTPTLMEDYHWGGEDKGREKVKASNQWSYETRPYREGSGELTACSLECF